MTTCSFKQWQEPLTRLHFYAIMFISEKAKAVKSDLNISFNLNKIIMNKSIAEGQLESYFYTLKETAFVLKTSTSTYTRKENAGKAPKGQKLFGRVKLYPKHEVILFAQGNWEGVK